MRYLFWVGIVLISYDLAGHLFCLIARLTGKNGSTLWNEYSTYVWPSISDSVQYDLYWTIFFSLAITMLVIGYVSKA